jgi:hypothetical protein
MIYLLAAATAGMFGYMLWMVAFRLRRDRVSAERDLTRGKFAFRPKERLRFLLNNAFEVPAQKEQWEDSLASCLSEPRVQTERIENR